jgi:hypothetical protein
MKAIQILFLTFFAIPFLVAQKNIKSEKIKIKKLNNPAYTLLYPGNWELNSSGENNIKFMLISPLSSEYDQFRENVNLNEQNIKGMGINLDSYVSLSIDQIRDLINNSEMLVSKRIKTKKSEYHQFVYNGDFVDLSLTFYQYCWVKQDKAYVLTFTAEKSVYEYSTEADIIMNSFKLK